MWRKGKTPPNRSRQTARLNERTLVLPCGLAGSVFPGNGQINAVSAAGFGRVLLQSTNLLRPQ